MLSGSLGASNDFYSVEHDPVDASATPGADTSVFNDVVGIAGAISADASATYRSINQPSSIQQPTTFSIPSNLGFLAVVGVALWLIFK